MIGEIINKLRVFHLQSSCDWFKSWLSKFHWKLSYNAQITASTESHHSISTVLQIRCQMNLSCRGIRIRTASESVRRWCTSLQLKCFNSYNRRHLSWIFNVTWIGRYPDLENILIFANRKQASPLYLLNIYSPRILEFPLTFYNRSQTDQNLANKWTLPDYLKWTLND